MEVAPTIHYAMGGVRVDAETGAASVPGLFAAGEVASGLHGANRLGGNSLSDLLVFGKRAGEAAAAAAKEQTEDAAERRRARDRGGDRRADGAPRPARRREPLQADGRDPGRDDRARADRPRRSAGCRRASRRSSDLRARAAGLRHRRLGHAARSTRAGTPRTTCARCSSTPRRCCAPRSNARRAAARTRGRTSRRRTTELARVNFIVQKTAARHAGERRRPIPPMPDYLAEAVQHSYARYTPEETE